MAQSNRERLRAEQAAQAKQAKNMRVFGFAAVAVAVVVLGVFGAVFLQALNKNGQVTPPNATADGSGIVAYPGTAKAGAPVVDLFFDYQCPVCKQLEAAHGAKLTELAKSGAIDLRYRPLIFVDEMVLNDSSQRAAIGAACADIAGGYAAYHDQVFANQPAEGVGYTDDQLRSTFPTSAGITGESLTKFQTCYDNRQTRDFVKAAAAANTPKSTPRMQVNGKDFDYRVATDQLADAIKKAVG
jgi:protein-disulfide isomerase